MTETEAHRALLLRAFEQPLSAPWTAEDAEAATGQALQRLGEHAAAPSFIAERALLGIGQLVRREPAAGAALAAVGSPRWHGRAAIALSLLAGAAADAAGATQRINILSPPLFALLLWNLAVCAALAWRAAGRRFGRRGAGHRMPGALAAGRHKGLPGGAGGLLRGTLARGLYRVVQRIASAGLPRGSTAAAPLARFVADAWHCGAALHAVRLAGMLHAAAAWFALAALASLYVRGLGFEYRAGWDSTFLTPASVHGLLSLLFAPALALAGTALPDADALARLRFSAGAGENAARWIHLQALTIGLFVVLPRGALAARAAWQARRLAADFRLPLDDPYFARLARLPGGQLLVVPVLPYSFQPPVAALPALTGALARLHGGAVGVRLASSVPLGGEDEADGWSAALAGASTAAVLFSLTATPERESHGAFAAAVAARFNAPGRLHVLVDEAAFRRRFSGTDGAARLEQRRDAWRRMLAEGGVAPHFIDSDAVDPGAA